MVSQLRCSFMPQLRWVTGYSGNDDVAYLLAASCGEETQWLLLTEIVQYPFLAKTTAMKWVIL